jgi:phospholipid/cholesterol/gamma-HCH transport system permease protein
MDGTVVESPSATPTFDFFAFIGRRVITFLEHLGRYFTLLWWVIRHLYFARVYARDVFRQMVAIGNNSIPIVIFTSAFVGMVTSVQSAHQLYEWIPRSVVGNLVIKTVLLELAPLLMALVLSGKVGATITAELGSMRVTEQIDALETLAFDSVSFLVTPRVVAGTVMFPVLVVIGDFVAILGGLFGAVTVSQIPAGAFIEGMQSSFLVSDALFGITKGTVFGFAITSIACYRGYFVEGGAEGVGKATMSTVVLACLTVVVLDFALASTLL